MKTYPLYLNGQFVSFPKTLAVVNPPFGFLDAAPEILGALLDRLGTRAAGEGLNVIRLVDE